MMQSMLGTTIFLTSGSFDILGVFVKSGSFGPSSVSHCYSKAYNHIIVLIMRVKNVATYTVRMYS